MPKQIDILKEILAELKKINEKLEGAEISFTYYRGEGIGISNNPPDSESYPDDCGTFPEDEIYPKIKY